MRAKLFISGTPIILTMWAIGVTPATAGPISAGSSIIVFGEFYPMGGTGLADATRIEFEPSDPHPVVTNVTGDFVGGGYMGDNFNCTDF